MVVTTMRRRLGAGPLPAALALVLAACTPTSPGQLDTTPSAEVLPLTIGLTYVPNIQFAPFYLAASEGYFADAGLDVTLRHHGASEDLFGALEAGEEDVVVAGGDEMLQARSQGVDVVSIATLYQDYPVVLIVPEDSDITTPGDLSGRTVGVPGPFGETYFGLLAMLDGAGLTDADVTIEHIGYTQQAALSSGHVDAVMGFVNNDVPQLEATGLDVRAIGLGADVPLVGISLGVAGDLIDADPEALRGLVTAVGRAVADIAASPERAVEASRDFIPGTLTTDQEQVALDTVTATVPLYGDVTGTWGAQDDATWNAMADFLLTTGLIASPVSAPEAHTNAFIASE